MSFGHKIKNKILLRRQAEEEEEIFKLDIRIEHLTLGDFYVEDWTFISPASQNIFRLLKC